MQIIVTQSEWREVMKSTHLKKSKQADHQSTIFFGEGIDPDHKLGEGVNIESFNKTVRDNDYAQKDLTNLMLAVYVVVVEYEGGRSTSYILDPNHESVGIRTQQRGIPLAWDNHDWGRWDNYLAYGLVGLIRDSGDQPEKIHQIVVWENASPSEIVDGWAEAAPDENVS